MSHRWGLFRSWPFLVSVAVLALNDHVFKQAAPGMVTGKLSDAAGVCMLAIALTAVTGWARTSVVATASAFALLKTVPAVAAMAAPLLGGQTRTDLSDVIVVLLLIPLAWWLDRAYPEVRAGADRIHDPRAVLRLAAIAGGVLAMTFTTTATSCDADPGIDQLVSDGGTVWAKALGSGTGTWYRSDDFGRSWATSDAPDTTVRATATEEVDGRPAYCLSEGSCFSLVADEEVSVLDGGSWRREYALPDDVRTALDEDDDGCSGGDLYDTATVVSSPDGDVLVVSMNNDGVLVRDATGEWRRVAVGKLSPSSAALLPPWVGALQAAPALLLGAAVVMAIALRRRRATTEVVAAAVLGMALFVAVGIASFFDFRASTRGLAVAAATVVCLIILVTSARRRPLRSADPSG